MEPTGKRRRPFGDERWQRHVEREGDPPQCPYVDAVSAGFEEADGVPGQRGSGGELLLGQSR